MALGVERDPRVDPEPGVMVHGSDGRVSLVLEVNLEDDDQDFGRETVRVREDTRWGQRLGATMALSTWRTWAEGAEVLDPGLADAFNEGGRKAVLGDLA